MHEGTYSILIHEGQSATWRDVLESEVRHLCEQELTDEEPGSPSALALFARLRAEAKEGVRLHTIQSQEIEQLRDSLSAMIAAEYADSSYACDDDHLTMVRCAERLEVLDGVAEQIGGLLGF